MNEYFLATTQARRDRTKRSQDQHPLRLLSLDGGGVRGFSTLLLIQELMLNLFVSLEGRAPRPEEIPRPCDHFDLIGGSGTGGLIGILLGRLRMDLETCKEVYVQVSRKVFESDKTIGGLPYRKTLFKASKLEEAIKEVVRKYGVRELNDNDTISNYFETASQLSPQTSIQRSFSSGDCDSSTDGSGTARSRRNLDTAESGNSLLYDSRPDRCKTFLTATYKGSDANAPPACLRTYESSQASTPSPNCTIWQAGRATCAHYPAFKSIQIGQDIFLDEGPGLYSPVGQVLEEAMVHEWPGREVGVLVSIGSGKKVTDGLPRRTKSWKGTAALSLLHSTSLGKFADARERHMAKMQDCEGIHLELLGSLERTGISKDNYFRVNVEVGVGDYGINEWSRMAEISTSTRRFLSRPEIQAMNQSAAEKLASIHYQAAYGRALRRDQIEPMLANYKQHMNHGLPALPQETEDGYSSEDEEISKHIRELQSITTKIHG